MHLDAFGYTLGLANCRYRTVPTHLLRTCRCLYELAGAYIFLGQIKKKKTIFKMGMAFRSVPSVILVTPRSSPSQRVLIVLQLELLTQYKRLSPFQPDRHVFSFRPARSLMRFQARRKLPRHPSRWETGLKGREARICVHGTT